jgi:antitoxin YefM
MDVVTYTAARNRLTQLLEKVTSDGAPVLITRQRGEPAVLISLEEYAALDETAHLLRSPKNAARLKDSLRELKSGKGVNHTLRK